MKYIWEELDLKDNWGRYVIENHKVAKSDGYLGLTKTWKIGGDGIHSTMTCMGDGLVVRYKSKLALIKHLNKNSGYRPLRKEELIDMINANWDCHEGIK